MMQKGSDSIACTSLNHIASCAEQAAPNSVWGTRLCRQIPNDEWNPPTRMKAPKTKLQTPKNFQSPSSKAASLRPILEFEAWDFSVAWCLGFGNLACDRQRTTDY